MAGDAPQLCDGFPIHKELYAPLPLPVFILIHNNSNAVRYCVIGAAIKELRRQNAEATVISCSLSSLVTMLTLYGILGL